MQQEDPFFEIRLAETAADIRAAQRLRYRVFATELGATGPTVDHASKRELDEFDAIYDHLLLIDTRRDAEAGDHVVGVYRLMRGDVAAAHGGFYSAQEYDLSPLISSGKRLLELGRSCVDADYRGGTAMFRLWNALAGYVLDNDIDILFGVASYHGNDVAPIAQSLSHLYHNHLAPPDMRVSVLPEYFQTLDLIEANAVDRRTAMSQTPALIKAYLRLGGYIGDGAYIDRNFNTIDVCLMMDTKKMSEKHRAYYVRQHEASA